ncbi:MAG: hypothetical protein ACXWG8_07780 [Usitatibacter sp.]
MTLAEELSRVPVIAIKAYRSPRGSYKTNSDETLARRSAKRTANREEAVRLAAQGLSPRMIGYKMKKSKSWVNLLLREHRELEEARGA